MVGPRAPCSLRSVTRILRVLCPLESGERPCGAEQAVWEDFDTGLGCPGPWGAAEVGSCLVSQDSAELGHTLVTRVAPQEPQSQAVHQDLGEQLLWGDRQ